MPLCEYKRGQPATTDVEIVLTQRHSTDIVLTQRHSIFSQALRGAFVSVQSEVPLGEYKVSSTCEEIECLCVSTMRACEEIECLCVSTKALDFLTGGADLSQRSLYLSLRERLSLYLTVS